MAVWQIVSLFSKTLLSFVPRFALYFWIKKKKITFGLKKHDTVFAHGLKQHNQDLLIVPVHFW